VALIKVGDVEAQAGRAAKALDHYQHALRIREQLITAAPTDTSIRRDLAEVWLKIGDALAWSGRKPEAVENYRKSAAALQELSSKIPSHAEIREMLTEASKKLPR
jgi:tetratricopeptide (TPR) repeat protein